MISLIFTHIVFPFRVEIVEFNDAPPVGQTGEDDNAGGFSFMAVAAVLGPVAGLLTFAGEPEHNTEVSFIMCICICCTQLHIL